MKLKNAAALIILLLSLQNVFAQDSTLTLQQCLDIALKNNAMVKQTESQMYSDKISWQQAKGNQLPFVSSFISHGISQGRSIDPFTNGYINQNISFANYGLNASLTLWNGSGYRNFSKQNELSYEASKMDLQQQKDNLTINVILAYLLVLNDEETLNATEQHTDVTRKQAERLELLNKDGAVAPATFYDMKGQLADEEMSVINGKRSLETDKLSLFELMNAAHNRNIELQKITISDVPLIYDATVDQIYQQALQQLAFIKAAELRRQSAEVSVKAAKGLLYPNLSLNGSLGTNYSNAATISTLTGTTDVATDNYVLINNQKVPVYVPQGNFNTQKISYGSQWKNNFNSSVTLGLQIPILNGLQAKSRLNQAKINQDQKTFEASTVKIQLRQDIEQAYLNMTASFERYQKLTSQVKDFGESFRSAEIRFNAGAITSVDYLIAKNNLDRANINLIAAKYDYLLRTKVLDFYQGKLSF